MRRHPFTGFSGNLMRQVIEGRGALVIGGLSAWLVIGGLGPALAAESAAGAGSGTVARELQALAEEIRALRRDVTRLRTEVRTLRRSRPEVTAFANPGTRALKEVKLGSDDPILGNPGAKLALVEFSDFECPFCFRFHKQAYPEIKRRYIDTGKLRYVFKDFPLGFHAGARPAAIAARCAAGQGKFWEMHEALFANQRALGEPLFGRLARDLSLDRARFDSCRQDPGSAAWIDQNTAEGEALGVRGTPTFFIGEVDGDKVVKAREISGAQPYAVFARVIESRLE